MREPRARFRESGSLLGVYTAPDGGVELRISRGRGGAWIRLPPDRAAEVAAMIAAGERPT